MKELKQTARFDKDFGLAFGDNANAFESFIEVIGLLARGEALPASFGDHPLGKHDTNYAGFRECHLVPDLILIYRVTADTVVLHRAGTHRRLFKAGKATVMDIRAARLEKQRRKWQ